MSKLTCAAPGVVVALALALLSAAPVAAAQPTRPVIESRTVIKWDPVAHFPAGEGCAFDVTAYTPPGGRTIVTVFGDGTTVYQVHAIHRRVVSDVTGIVYHNDIVALGRERLDNGVVKGTITGRFIWTFLPGDVGPGGVVFDHVMSLDIVGWATYVQDPDTWATLAFSLHGKYTDICAAISGDTRRP